MPYVIRRDNPTGDKYKFSYFTGNSRPQFANRFDCTVRVPVFPSKRAVVEWLANKVVFNARPLYTWEELELNGWELVQVRNRKVEGLMVHAINYNNNVRALAGTSAMMSGLYHRLGYPTLAKETEGHCKGIKAQLARTYAETKRQLEEGMKNAK